MKEQGLFSTIIVIIIMTSVILAGCTSPTEQKVPTTLTKTADADEVLTSLDGYLENSALSWHVNNSFCSIKTCRQQLIANNGDQLVVSLTIFGSLQEASDTYSSMKEKMAHDSINDVNIGDAGYAWHNSTLSENVFLSRQAVGMVGYFPRRGNTTGQESYKIAVALADLLD